MKPEQYRQRLLEMKQQLEERLARTHRHIHEKAEPVSAKFDEQVKETENDQLVYMLDQEAQDELHQIEHALQRIEDGSYGQCSECGEAIAEARLAAIPFADLCIECADKA